jgi:CTP:molybdopterin cytidylyltransferase MocA
MMTKSKSIGVVILAGGRSSRMVYPKLWLYLTGGDTFLEHLENTYYSAGVSRVVTVINQEFGVGEWESKVEKLNKETLVVLNKNVDKGRMHSLSVGLEEIKDCDYVLIQNVDSPLIEIATIEHLIKNCENHAVTQPVFHGKGGHPVLIAKPVVNDILGNRNIHLTLKDVLNKYKKNRLSTEDEHVLMNVNTFDKYLEMKNEFI